MYTCAVYERDTETYESAHKYEYQLPLNIKHTRAHTYNHNQTNTHAHTCLVLRRGGTTGVLCVVCDLTRGFGGAVGALARVRATIDPAKSAFARRCGCCVCVCVRVCVFAVGMRVVCVLMCDGIAECASEVATAPPRSSLFPSTRVREELIRDSTSPKLLSTWSPVMVCPDCNPRRSRSTTLPSDIAVARQECS
jgi:hypothetical protein